MATEEDEETVVVAGGAVGRVCLCVLLVLGGLLWLGVEGGDIAPPPEARAKKTGSQ